MSHQQQMQKRQQTSTVSQNMQQQQTQMQQTQQMQQTMQTQQQSRVIREVRQGGGPMQMPVGLPPGASPPVFEQIFRNARFAQGGDALFEGKIVGNPKPTISWTRKGQPIRHGQKYQITHDKNTGKVTIQICAIGPGDEGDYVCTASNEYGDAICTVYIQPEAAYMMQQQRQMQQQQQTQQQTFMQQQQMQRRQQQQHMQNGQVESFRVDTFEYRILHEVEFRQSLTKKVRGEVDVSQTGPLQGPAQAPTVQQKPRSTKVNEHQNATFTVKVSANPSARIIWFKNGERIFSSDKYTMTQSAGQVTLVIKNVNIFDNGYYTMLAENSSGCTVASAQLAVVKGPDSGPEVVRQTDKMETFQQQAADDDSGKSMEPKFVRIPPHQTVQEGKMVRFDCRATGRPYPDVTWFLNGRPIANDANHKILVNEQGNHSLMITQATLQDAGVITCVAKNKSGETSFQVQLNVIEKEQLVAPKFVERFQQGQVREGETVQLPVRAVGTPIPSLSWQKDGVAIMPTPNIQIQSDGGNGVLQILSATPEDAGWYQCTAKNVAGSTSTRARLHVQKEKPAPTPPPTKPPFKGHIKFIEPEKEPGPEIIYLRHVEPAHQQIKGPEEEQPEPPRFTHLFRDIDVAENQRAHFEARVIPIGDATMQIEWLKDGKPMRASSRTTATYRFGYVALDLLHVVKEDTAVYTCRATNVMGQAETSANLRVTEKPAIDLSTQHPDAMEKIPYLEDHGKYQRSTSMEDESNVKPAFVKPLSDLGDLMEGKYAHFEAQLIPVSDPYLKVEWFKDGKPITASSRINVIHNFGYVAMTMMQLRPEDTGIYTVKASNKVGECSCQAAMRVLSATSVTGELGIPEQAQYIRSVEEMEAYRKQMQERTAKELLERTTAPVFKTNLKNAAANESGYAHFEARLEPIGDPTLKVEWLKDGRPIEASSRITTFFNFGYVALTIKALTPRDAGTYTCRAHNAKGEATNVATLTVLSKTDIELDSQYEDTAMKMQFLEDAARHQRTAEEEAAIVKIPPKFLGPLKGTTKILEGQTAHFEGRLEPQNDPTMRVEWYFNGKPLMDASRIKFYNDFGYVALDIKDVRSSDTGTYTVVARNSLGEAQVAENMEVECE